MPEMEGPAKAPPQISEMFQKFALAFKTKTIEFFADEEDDDADPLSLLDSTEEVITGQRVVVIKPDQLIKPTPPAQLQQQQQYHQHQQLPSPPPQQQQPQQQNERDRYHPDNLQIVQTLISSLFATISSFEASYLQFQTAHAPFDADNIKTADRALVSHLQRLSELKQSYRDFRKNPTPNPNFPIALSDLEAQVQENQSLLRTLEIVVNTLQSDIDLKDAEVSTMKQKLEKIQNSNLRLSKRLCNSNSTSSLNSYSSSSSSSSASSSVSSSSSSSEVLLSVGVFSSVLQDACRSVHSFTKLLISLMKKAGWDLDLAANSVQPGIDYVKRGHNRYAFLSYVCLVMFEGFDLEGFGLGGDEIEYNGVDLSIRRKNSLRQFVEHGTGNEMELLNRDPSGDFARFCENKYEQLIHPTMESSLFKTLDQNELVLSSWRASAAFHELFVNMASSIWMLHKLAFSFDPPVEIFQVERGVDFSMVYMENVTREGVTRDQTRAKVGFTVIPGFRIGRTVIQSQVYLIGTKRAD
ncbi:PREDICTED: IRK-interacting protein-like [Nelumbo nucifera]|uniref:IRK-interacting protein-like n=2 Tax=Nelumbo nucifera TaxID=4432 RepID=A0A822ZWE3_NELNU|nr:PREDICTED: IRK-interacting protein-like [Nelumbo nucifera]DAD47851.1 TPA_asm: hypothetical protein HUJ06_017788 [Nelumbo nucifera]